MKIHDFFLNDEVLIKKDTKAEEYFGPSFKFKEAVRGVILSIGVKDAMIKVPDIGSKFYSVEFKDFRKIEIPSHEIYLSFRKQK